MLDENFEYTSNDIKILIEILNKIYVFNSNFIEKIEFNKKYFFLLKYIKLNYKICNVVSEEDKLFFNKYYESIINMSLLFLLSSDIPYREKIMEAYYFSLIKEIVFNEKDRVQKIFQEETEKLNLKLNENINKSINCKFTLNVSTKPFNPSTVITNNNSSQLYIVDVSSRIFSGMYKISVNVKSLDFNLYHKIRENV